MGFSLHNISMPSGAGPAIQDRLLLANVLALPFPARNAGSVGAAGAVTAGTGYTVTPTLTPTGGTVTPQVLTGGQVTTPVGWQALFRAVMKVVSATVPAVAGGGGSGYVTNDVVYFGNGIFLTATASAGVVTAWAVTQAGSFTQPGGLPGTTLDGPVPQITTSGVGVGALATLVWGIGSVSVDDSGNYSVLPTGITVTSVDGNGSAGAVGAPVVVTAAAGASVFRAVYIGSQPVQPTIFSATDFPAPNYGFSGQSNSAAQDVSLVSKQYGYAVVAITPTLATGNVAAGALDALFWA